MLVAEEAGAASKSHIVMFEEDTTKDGFIGYEGYRYSEEVNGYFVLTGSAERKNLATVKPSVNEVLKLIQPRFIDNKVKSTGTCFDHAFVSGADSEWGETVAIMANFGNVRIGLSTQVIDRPDEGPSLLQRAHRINGFPQAKILRKIKRRIAGLNGEELAFIDVPGDEYTPFSCQWECEGKSNSVGSPRIQAFQANTGKISQTTEELLGLWDAVLESIHLRPGAV